MIPIPLLNVSLFARRKWRGKRRRRRRRRRWEQSPQDALSGRRPRGGLQITPARRTASTILLCGGIIVSGAGGRRQRRLLLFGVGVGVGVGVGGQVSVFALLSSGSATDPAAFAAVLR